MKIMSDEEIVLVWGGMRLPPYDPNEVYVGTTDMPSPPPPRRSDFPPGPGGDAAYRYEHAVWLHNRYQTVGYGCV